MYKTIHAKYHHFGWNHSLKPISEIQSGETLSFELMEASGGQLHSASTAKDIATLDFEKVNPVTGPVYIADAEPGDAIQVDIVSLGPRKWGWTANIPGFGLLADQFKEPYLKIWSLEDNKPAEFLDGILIPQNPFPGTIGLAPKEEGVHSIVPPRICGGNMDIRDLTAGSTLYLPVQVKGALFSVGDSHAAQGDGEVCGTAIESPMNVTLRFQLIKNANLPAPQFETKKPVTRHIDQEGYYATTGLGPDLFQASKDAVMAMIDHLGKHYKLSPEDAYLLCSVSCDLRISEIVDTPNWLVSFYLPSSIFRRLSIEQ